MEQKGGVCGSGSRGGSFVHPFSNAHLVTKENRLSDSGNPDSGVFGRGGLIQAVASRLRRGLNNRVLRQFSALAAGRGIATILSALWLILLARTLSGVAFGYFALILAIGGMTGVFGDLGLQTALADETARLGYLNRTLIITVIRRRLLLCVGVVVAVTGMFLAVSRQGSPWAPLIFGGSIFGTAVYSSETAALTALGRAQVDATNEWLSRLGVLVLGGLWIKEGGGLYAAVSAYAIADLCSAVVVSVIASRSATTEGAEPRGDVFSLKRTVHLALALPAAVIYARVDIWLLALLKGASLSGRYAAADKILDAVLLAPATIGTISIAHTSSVPIVMRWPRARNLLGLGLLFSLPSAVLVAVFSRPLLVGLFGSPFRVVAITLVILVLSAPAGSLASVGAPIAAVATGWRFTVAVLVGLIVNVALNLALIPSFNANGAAIANLVSETFLGVALTILIRRATRPPTHIDR